MEKETYGFQKTWEEVVELKARVSSLIRKAEIREMNTVVIDKLSYVENALEELDEIITDINNGDYEPCAINCERDRKIFLLDKMTFPNALNFSGSEEELEVMVASNSYFDDDIVKIDANGYDSVKDAIKNEWCNLSSEDSLEDVLKDWYVIPFGF